MKSILKITCLFFISLSTTWAQNVTILPGGITPATASSIPTLTYDEIQALPSPGFGSLANDITFKCLRYYDGSEWAKVATSKDSAPTGTNVWSGGGLSNDGGEGIAVDANGNIYVTGYFQGTANFGNISLDSQGSSDIFLARYNKSGALQWIKKAGGGLNDSGKSLAIDNNGNVFVTGHFTGTANFENTILTSAGKEDVFIAKYTSSGALEWVQKAGGVNTDEANDLALDANGNVYVVGGYTGGAIFGTKVVTGFGQTDMFMAKYTSAGSFEWVKASGGASSDYCNGIAIDGDGAIYICGSFTGTINFGNNSITSNGENDIFLAKYIANNDTWAWAKQAGGVSYDFANDVVIDADGYIWLAGGFKETASFGNGYIQLKSVGSYDVFLAKYNKDGTLQINKSHGGRGDEYITNMAIDATGNVYVTGSFQDIIDIGKMKLESAGSSEIFFAKFKTNGILDWAQSAEGLSGEYPNSIAVQPNGNAYVTGYFYDSIKFGNVSIQGEGNRDFFVVRIRD